MGVSGNELRPLVDARGNQQRERLEHDVGAGLRRRRVVEELTLWCANDGAIRGQVEDSWPADADDPLWIADPDNPEASLMKIAEHASALLDRFGLPYLGKSFAKGADGAPEFYFWEDEQGRLRWGERAPAGVQARRVSFVPPDQADRIAREECIDGPW
jgi:hypothetical protein